MAGAADYLIIHFGLSMIHSTTQLVVPLGPANAVESVHSGVFVAVVIEGDMGAAKSFCKAFHSPYPSFLHSRLLATT